MTDCSVNCRVPESAAAAQAPGQEAAGKSSQAQKGRPTSVTLDESKFAVAKIKLEAVRVEEVATGAAVVGQIQANLDQQVDIRPRASGIVRESPVKQGQNVKRGDTLVTLDSRGDRHRAAEPASQAARAVDGAVRGTMEVRNRGQRRPAHSRAEERNRGAPQRACPMTTNMWSKPPQNAR